MLTGAAILASVRQLDQRISNYRQLSGCEVEFSPSLVSLVGFDSRRISEHGEETNIVVVVVDMVPGEQMLVEGMHIDGGNHLEKVEINENNINVLKKNLRIEETQPHVRRWVIAGQHRLVPHVGVHGRGWRNRLPRIARVVFRPG